jgi:MFS family permease
MHLTALRYPAARRMLFAQANQGAAGWMLTTAGSWYVLTETGSTTALAFFVVVSMTPSLFLNPVGGRLMDRHSPVTMVKILAPLTAAPSLLLALLYVTGVLTVPLMLALVLVAAVFRALQAPTFNKILPHTVPEDQRATVLGYSAITFNLSRSIGPLIAGLAGTQWAFLFAGLGYLLVAGIVFLTRLPDASSAAESASRGPDDEASSEHGYRDAFVMAWTAAALKSLFVCVFVFYLVSGSVHQLLAAVAKDTSSTSVALGVLYASAAVGAMIANPPVLAYLRQGRSRSILLTVIILGVGVTVTVFGFSTTLVADMLLMVVMGALGEAMYLSAQRSILLELDDSRSGAVFGLFLGALTAAGIVGSLGLGLLMDEVGVRDGLVAIGLATILAAIPVLWLVAHQERSKPEVPTKLD